jgi:aspartokinase
MRADPEFLPRSIAMLRQLGLEPDLVVSSEVALAAAVADCEAVGELEKNAPPDVDVELGRDRGLLCVVGTGLVDEACRGRVIRALGEYGPELVALGGSETSLTAVVERRRLESSVRDLHRRFFEEEDSGE